MTAPTIASAVRHAWERVLIEGTLTPAGLRWNVSRWNPHARVHLPEYQFETVADARATAYRLAHVEAMQFYGLPHAQALELAKRHDDGPLASRIARSLPRGDA